ncbi:12731_t:CDS:2, partial [Ambispora gerdemannii]
MPQIHTLSDIGEGKKLGDIPSNRYSHSRMELENQLAYKDNKRMQYDLNQSDKDKEKLFKHSYQLINEVKRLKVDNTNLTSQIIRSQISCDEYKASKLASAQKGAFLIQENSSKKDSEIMSLKAELKHIKNKLASKIDELERLKSNTISTNNSSSHNNLAQYFVRKKKDESILIHESSKVSTPILAHDNIDDTKYQTPEIKKNMTPISTNVRVSAKSNSQIYNITKEGGRPSGSLLSNKELPIVALGA